MNKDFSASRQENSVEKRVGGKPKKTKQEVVCDYIYENYGQWGSLRFDDIANKVQLLKPVKQVRCDGKIEVETCWQYLSDADINTMVCNCCKETGVNIGAKEIRTVLYAGDEYIKHVNPLQDYVYSRKAYDPVHEPDWLEMVGRFVELKYPTDWSDEQKNELYNRWLLEFKMWMVGMVAGWIRMDNSNQAVLLLIGRQGIFKTTFLEYLLPPELRHYCSKLSSTRELKKDDRLRIVEFGMVNLDELDAMGRREMNVLKSVITATDVNERVAYGYTKERRPRIASFCGSSNNKECLTDLTGLRRFWPYEVENIKNPHYHFSELLYDRMYAQALHLYESGFKYWYDSCENEELEQYKEEFRMKDAEEDLLLMYFDIPHDGGGVFMTAAQIQDKLITMGSIKRPMHVAQFGRILSKMGFKKTKKGSLRTSGYWVYERNSDEIAANKRLRDV